MITLVLNSTNMTCQQLRLELECAVRTGYKQSGTGHQRGGFMILLLM